MMMGKREVAKVHFLYGIQGKVVFLHRETRTDIHPQKVASRTSWSVRFFEYFSSKNPIGGLSVYPNVSICFLTSPPVHFHRERTRRGDGVRLLRGKVHGPRVNDDVAECGSDGG